MFRLIGYFMEQALENFKDDPEFQKKLEKLHQEHEKELSRIQAENDMKIHKWCSKKWWQFWRTLN